jgi:hypothetical protein
METIYQVKTTVSQDGTITIKKLPFQAGDQVEVTVRGREHKVWSAQGYPLRGIPIHYEDPFGSVARNDWNVLS